MTVPRLAVRHALALGAFALALAWPAVGAPPAGTVISNQATATAVVGVTPVGASSNVVQLTTAGAGGGGAATLVEGATRRIAPGGTAYFPHTLTNSGAGADTFLLSTDNLAGLFDLATITMLPDANGDGIPDSAAPIAPSVTLPAGGVFRFVVSATAPANAPPFSHDSLQVNARSTAPGGPMLSNIDNVVIEITTAPPLDLVRLVKSFSVEAGPSPYESILVSIRYGNTRTARSDFRILDEIPAGFSYVPGSARWGGSGDQPLTDAAGGDPAGIDFDFGVTQPGAISARIGLLGPNESGELSFRMAVVPDRAVGEILTNVAKARWTDPGGADSWWRESNPAEYRVTGQIALSLTGDRVPLAQPGTTVSFGNVLTNRGTLAETFNIVLGASTFPAGTPMRLYGPDGTTPLADTNGDGIPDVGILAPGQSVRIVVKVDVPATLVPGEYSVQKTAQSARAPSRRATASDVLAAVGRLCRVDLTPDNQAQSGYGRHVTYSHYLDNRGNCEEHVSVLAGFIADSLPGWVSGAYIDNPVAGGASIPGVLDATDTPVVQGWTATLAPGRGLRILVDVLAPAGPPTAKSGDGKAAPPAKALVETNTTTLTIDSATGGSLQVVDRTTIDDQDASIRPQNVLNNFTDSSYRVPTAWAVLGGTAWLRADAASCNADPAVAETRTVVITGANGEREEVVATETGPDTGIFVVPAMPVRATPVVAGDRILQGRGFDVFDAEILGCGRRIATAITLTEPVGVVFGSTANEPVAGAVVTLVQATGGRCSAVPVPTAGNPATTGADGRYAFAAAPAGDYCVVVSPPNGYAAPSRVPYTQLVPGRNLVVTGPVSGGSYGQPFSAGGNGIVVDVPVDPVAQSGLFVQKAASRAVADLGGFVDYVVSVRNGTGNALDRAGVQLVDNLPAGFAYVPETGRNLAGEAREPATRGPRLVFDVGHLKPGELVGLTYRVRVGPGALQGDGVNRVQASYTANGVTTVSNVATAKVQVIGGVFSSRAYILGKVFLDCNANGTQDRGEIGMPGVRLFIEDGTFVMTDGEGKFSFYGLPDRTHVLKVDPATLPEGARLAVTGTRNLGDPGSRIVDLKSGELHRGDFAIAGCAAPLLEEAKLRAKALEGGVDALAALSGAQLATQPPVFADVKALPASGLISSPGQPGGAAAPALDAPVGFTSNAPLVSAIDVPLASRPTPAPRLALGEGAAGAPPPAPALPALEDLVAGFDNSLSFVGIKDGDAMAVAQATIRVKGAAGATFKLFVNGAEVPEARVGKRSTHAEKQVQAWEYVGVDLKAGANELELAQFDSVGLPRGVEKIRVMAPGRLGKIAIELPKDGGVADGKTPVKVVVKLFDADGQAVTSRTPVTLEASRGAWMVEDRDQGQPGVQVFIEGGRGEFPIAPPLDPGPGQIAVTSGNLRAAVRLDFLPELRSLVAAGVIEGVVNMRNINTRALVPTREADGFEQELRHISRQWDDGKDQAGARAAFYLRGKIKGEYLLTAAYDSEKDTRERLFRDIQPDEFYPVYGDSGVRGYDAQSTSRLYVRVDHQRSYLLWGDFTTQAFPDLRRLSTYNRSLTGAQLHHENERISANAFASKDSTRQVIEELRANGTSGPYQLGSSSLLVNSEKIELVTRDRNQPALIVATVPQARFADYEIEPLTGRLLFKSPVSSVDRDLNPVFIRATYEVDQGGDEFWVAGVDAQVRVTDRIEVGGVYVKDKNPQVPFELAGANAVVKVGEGTYVIGEVARTTRGLDDKTGDAARLELKHESRDLKAQVYAAKSDPTFDNPGAWITSGRSESGGRIEYRVAEGTTARAEALRTEDTTTGSVRDGALAAVSHQLTKDINVEVGIRHAAEKGATSPVPPVEGLPPPQPMPDEVTTVRARLTGAVPGIPGAQVYGEAEVDVRDSDRRILAAGGEYQLPNRGRIYARHEFVSSITGPYGLNATERQNTTAVGVDVDYMRDGRLFSEYRIRDAMSGGDTEAAIGLRNLWTLAPGLRLGTSIERVHALSGTGQNENTALALGLEYTANPLWKGTTRLEVRDATTAESLLFTVGVAAKLSRDWTALLRNAYSLQRNKATEAAPAADKVIERLQAGIAWRDSETNQWNALGRVEHRVEEDETLRGIALKSSTQIVSLHADWQPRRPFLVTGRYAAKWSTEKSGDVTTKYRAQLVGGRATWEFAPRWDIGLVASLLIGDSTDSRQYGVGVELGYLVVTNLWVSAGYNFFGYRDADLQGADYTAKGPYVRLRYKFDEGLFGEGQSGSPKASADLANPTKPETASPSVPATPPAASGGFAPLSPSSGPASAGDQGAL